MRNIGLLLKNYLLCGIGSFRRKNTRTKSIVGISIITIISVGWFAFFTWCMWCMADTLAKFNLQANVLTMGLIISLFISVMFALQKVTGGQKANDTELLLSMPFRKTEIMVAKALSRFAYNLVVVLMFFLPSIIAYLVTTPFSMAALCGCLVVMLLVPLLAVGLSYVVDYCATVCFSNTKLGNIGKAIFTLIVLIGAVVIYEFVMLNSDAPFMMKLVSWMITFNPLVMIPLITGVILLFVLGNWLNALLLNREARSSHVKPSQISAKSITPFRAILKNESNRYFNSPTMMLNTLIGPLGIIALTIWVIIDQGETLTNLFAASLGLAPEFSNLIISILFAGLTILTYPAAFSISLEGKQLWILRSMPIPASTVLNAKVLFNILLVSPVAIICSIVMQIGMHLSVVNEIAMLVIPVLSNILVSYAGVFINLSFPKLEFESEAAVIKQSMSSFVMMLAGMLVITGLIVMVVFLAKVLSLIALTAIIIAILAVSLAVMMTLTYTIGQRMFNRL